MTRVYIEQDGTRYMIFAEGHAGAVDACNYITGVMYAFAGYVRNAEAEGRCEVYGFNIDADGNNPQFLVHCGGDERVEAAFEAAVIGLQQLAQTRPENIAIDLAEENC